MLSNAYFLAKFRFDTAENEPAKNLQNFRKMQFRKMHFLRRRGRRRSLLPNFALHSLAAGLAPDGAAGVLGPRGAALPGRLALLRELRALRRPAWTDVHPLDRKTGKSVSTDEVVVLNYKNPRRYDRERAVSRCMK